MLGHLPSSCVAVLLLSAGQAAVPGIQPRAGAAAAGGRGIWGGRHADEEGERPQGRQGAAAAAAAGGGRVCRRRCSHARYRGELGSGVQAHVLNVSKKFCLMDAAQCLRADLALHNHKWCWGQAAAAAGPGKGCHRGVGVPSLAVVRFGLIWRGGCTLPDRVKRRLNVAEEYAGVRSWDKGRQGAAAAAAAGRGRLCQF